MRARVLATLGRGEEARDEFALALAADASLGDAHEGLGTLALSQGRQGEALSEYRKAIRLEPANGEFVYSEARVLLASSGAEAEGEIAAALDRAASLYGAAEWHLVSPEVSIGRADLAAALGDDGERARHLREAQRLYGELGITALVDRLGAQIATSAQS